jgi:hypothetical protein
VSELPKVLEQFFVIEFAALVSGLDSVLKDIVTHVAVKRRVEYCCWRVEDIIEIDFTVQTVENLLQNGNIEGAVKTLTDAT